MSKSVLITSQSFGQVSNEPVRILSENGFDIEFIKGIYNEQEFIKNIHNFDAIIIGAHEFSHVAMGKATKLKIICKHGAGVDNIDLKTAEERNIRVTNVPGENANAVADLTFGLIIDVARKLSFSACKVKKGLWERSIGVDVYQKTLGLIGFGAIAKNVAKRALGFDMKVLAYDSFVTVVPDTMPHVQLVNFDEVIKNADFLSIHVPLNDMTSNLINKKQMAMMKRGSFIINTSRGGVVNEGDLYEYLTNGMLAGAGLDVTEKEPPNGSPLLTLDNITIVPHIGMYSREAINAVSMICAENVIKMFNGDNLDNIVV